MKKATIRKAQIKDAKALRNTMMQVDAESPFMLWSRNERPGSVRSMERSIRHLNKQNGGAVFVVEVRGNIVGFLVAMRYKPKKARHVAFMFMGVRKQHAGKGIGSSLMEAFVAWGKETNLKRLEFDVLADNKRGIALYRKYKFKKEGVKKKAIYDNGVYKNLFVMARIL